MVDMKQRSDKIHASAHLRPRRVHRGLLGMAGGCSHLLRLLGNYVVCISPRTLTQRHPVGLPGILHLCLITKHNMSMDNTPITVTAQVQAPLEKVWNCWTQPEHVLEWNAAIDDWHCPSARNSLWVGGDFSYLMAARDGSFSFAFEGTYTAVEPHKLIAFTMSDGRTVTITFQEQDGGVLVNETFDPEQMNPREMQQQGWQMILDRFKRHVEGEK